MFSFFKKLSLGKKLKALFSKKIDEVSLKELEKLFYEADLGVLISLELTEKVRSLLKKELPSKELIQEIKEGLLFSLLPPPSYATNASPYVIFIVGVNGSGKTTSLAKLAYHYSSEKKKILLVAADTYRAAAMEQLSFWADKLHLPLVKSQPKQDPSAVVFDALTSAKAKNFDLVLIDTAGRLHTKEELMQELKKMLNVMKKVLPDAPHETLLVVDATTGQNALDQAKIFNEITPLDGIFLSKLDGTAKGGIAVAIERELKIPVKWIGIGESEKDLLPFDPMWFIEKLLESSL